ncbi:hypothetical protein D9M72_441320 [compost metagenome]
MLQLLKVQLVKVHPVMARSSMLQPVKRTPVNWLDDQLASLKVVEVKLLPLKQVDVMVMKSRSSPE